MKYFVVALTIIFGVYASAAAKATCAIFEIKAGGPINDLQTEYNADPLKPLTLQTTDAFFTSKITKQDDGIHGLSVSLKAGGVATAAFFPEPLSDTTLTLIVDGRKGQVVCNFN